MNNSSLKIAVLDDAFPNLATGFRIAEFNWLIEHLNVHVFSTNRIAQSPQQTPYASFYPQNISYIHPIKDILQPVNQDIDLLYIIFMSNVAKFLPYIQKLNKPYIFSAYNSDRLRTNTPTIDHDFHTFLNDPLCKGTIVVQKMWHDYLLKKRFCPSNKIKFIYGGVSNVPPTKAPKKRYKQDKQTFDICFTAFLYTPSFVHSKGYDFFIEVARKLIKKDSDFRFHIIGSAHSTTIDVSDIQDFITFHGKFNMNQFASFYPTIDLMLSATRPTYRTIGKLTQTTADGFPTISAVEAAKCGVFLMVTDPLNNNIYFKNNKDICIIPDDVDSAVHQILAYKNNPDAFYRLAKSCQQAFQSVFDLDFQMQQRIQFFQEALKN